MAIDHAHLQLSQPMFVGPRQHQEGERCQEGLQEEDATERRGAKGICAAPKRDWSVQGQAEKRIRLQTLGWKFCHGWAGLQVRHSCSFEQKRANNDDICSAPEVCAYQRVTMHHFVMCLQYWGNKDMKADPDLKDMEARLAAFEKRSWVSCQKDHWVAGLKIGRRSLRIWGWQTQLI